MKRAQAGEARCDARAELTPNSTWQCKWPAGHEGDHKFERIGWSSK